MSKMIVLHADDNVGTLTAKMAKGDLVEYEVNGERLIVQLVEDIPLGHKAALKDFNAEEHIIKYGEVIGKANRPIKKGALVHIDNVESLRGRGDLKKEEQHS